MLSLSRSRFAHLLVATAVFALPAVALVAQSNECAGIPAPLLAGANGPFSNAGATTSSPAWPCGGGANDVWFSHVATCNGFLTVETCGANFDTTLEVLVGTCANLASLDCNDDFCGLQSLVTVPVISGTTYFIRVGGHLG